MHLADVQEHRVVADDVVGQVADVVDRRVLADVAGDDHAVGDARRHLHVVMFEHDRFEPGDAHQAGELAAADQPRVERIGHQEQIPVVAGVGVLHQGFDFVGAEVPPRGLTAKLFVAEVEFVLVRRQILRRDELARELLARNDFYVGHDSRFSILDETFNHEDSRCGRKMQDRWRVIVGGDSRRRFLVGVAVRLRRQRREVREGNSRELTAPGGQPKTYAHSGSRWLPAICTLQPDSQQTPAPFQPRRALLRNLRRFPRL